MELDIVHIATAVVLAAADSLDSIFDDLFTPFDDNAISRAILTLIFSNVVALLA